MERSTASTKSIGKKACSNRRLQDHWKLLRADRRGLSRNEFAEQWYATDAFDFRSNDTSLSHRLCERRHRPRQYNALRVITTGVSIRSSLKTDYFDKTCSSRSTYSTTNILCGDGESEMRQGFSAACVTIEANVALEQLLTWKLPNDNQRRAGFMDTKSWWKCHRAILRTMILLQHYVSWSHDEFQFRYNAGGMATKSVDVQAMRLC